MRVFEVGFNEGLLAVGVLILVGTQLGLIALVRVLIMLSLSTSQARFLMLSLLPILLILDRVCMVVLGGVVPDSIFVYAFIILAHFMHKFFE